MAVLQELTQWGTERYDRVTWHDLLVFAVDRALLRTPDTPEPRKHFGSENTSSDLQIPFPILSLIALMNVRSHAILDAQLSPYRRSEMHLVDEFFRQNPDHSIMLFDNGFWRAELLSSLHNADSHRHWLIPVKKGTVCEEVVRYNKHDRLLRMIVMAAANPGSATGSRMAKLRKGVGGLFLDHRPRPVRPRTVNISKTRFPVDRKAALLK